MERYVKPADVEFKAQCSGRRDKFKQERLPAETRIANGSALGAESVDLKGHIRDGGCEWWRTSRQSETLQNSLGGIRWMDRRENFHRDAAHFPLEKTLFINPPCACT